MKKVTAIILASMHLICFFKIRAVTDAGRDLDQNKLYGIQLSLDMNFSPIECSEAFPFDVAKFYTKDADKVKEGLRKGRQWMAVGVSTGSETMSYDDMVKLTGHVDLPK